MTTDIEDALDEFVFAVPVHEHRHMLMYWRHIANLSKCRENIGDTIEKENLLDHLHVESVRAGGNVDPLTHQFLVEVGS